MTGRKTDANPAPSAALFDQMADGYDAPPLRYAAFAADQLVRRLAPVAGEKLLDVAAGTGAVTLAAAQAVGPAGRVVAIDVSERMLERLESKIRQFGIGNVDVHVMDGSRLDFRGDYFHCVTCGFGLFHMADMGAALEEWRRVLRPGGQVMFSSFGARTFEPMRTLYFRRLAELLGRPLRPSMPLSDPEKCRRLLEKSGFGDVRVETGSIRYHLKDATEWWEVVRSLPWRRFLGELDPAAHDSFRSGYLADIQARVGESGLLIEFDAIYAAGRKRATRDG